MSQSQIERDVEALLNQLHKNPYDDQHKVNMAWDYLLKVKVILCDLEGEK